MDSRAMNPKFIIENDNLILMRVKYHIEIVTDEKKVKGGGWYRQNENSQTITFYDRSEAYGAAKFDDIKDCIKKGKVYKDKNLTECIAGLYNFSYDNGKEVIVIYTIKNGMIG